MNIRLRVSHRGWILVLVPLVFEAILIVGLGSSLNELEIEVNRERHFREILRVRQEMDGGFYGTYYSAKALLDKPDLFSSPDGEFIRASYLRSRADVNSQYKLLCQLTAEDKKETVDLSSGTEAVDLVNTALGMMDEYVRNARRPDNAASSEMDARASLPAREALTALHKFHKILDRIESANSKRQQEVRENLKTLLGVEFLVGALSAVWLANYFSQMITSRLKQIGQNFDRFMTQKDLQPRLGGFDEISALDDQFHHMADALNQSIFRERLMVINAPQIICTLDAELVITQINPAVSLILGYPPNDVLHQSITKLVGVANRGDTRRSFSAALNSPGATSFETTLLAADNSERFFLWTIQWSMTENALYCVAQDISDKKQAEALKENVMSMVTHDLRSPLSSVNLILQSLTEMDPQKTIASIAEDLNLVRRNTGRLMRLTNALLDFERLESGDLPLEKTDVQAADLCHISVEAVSRLSQDKEITVSLSITPPDLSLVCDEERIVEALVNLVSNAIKFSPEQSTIAVIVRQDNQSVRFAIQDSGPGIALDDQSRVFERFQQVVGEQKKQTGIKGTGLGLPICRLIIARHGGEIGVNSEPGKGSTFWFTIPAAASQTGPERTC